MVTWNTAFMTSTMMAGKTSMSLGGPYPGAGSNTMCYYSTTEMGTFLDLSLLSGTSSPNYGFEPGGAFTDFNNDGFMDTLLEGAGELGRRGTSPHLHMNNGRDRGNPNHWLEVKLIGTVSNRDAIRARLSAKVGAATLQRWVFNTGYQGNSTLIQHLVSAAPPG